MSTATMALVEAYLSNMQLALKDLDVPRAEVLLTHTLELITQGRSYPRHQPMRLAVSVGLDPGISRKDLPNEDCAFAVTGYHPQTNEPYGLFVVADGMGGHVHGQLASRFATETVVDTVLPALQNGQVRSAEYGRLLVDAVCQANHVIYERNQGATSAPSRNRMGTTITAAVITGPHAFIANVGDSRTYLYRPGVGLHVVTRDHSVVAELVAMGGITPEEIYTHPQRNQITRCLGEASAVEVDLFHEQLENGDTLLLCSDGMWEMTRDTQIAHILSSPLSADQMAEHLLRLALQGGGKDNIGLVISQCQMNMAAMSTLCYPISSFTAVAS